MIHRILVGLFICQLVCAGTMFAQEKTKSKQNQVHFASYNQFNLLHGYGSLHAGFQSVNGVAFNQSFLGAGVAIDWYGLRSVPLFAEFRQEFNIGKLVFFAYGDLGYNFPWTDDNITPSFGITDFYQRGGIYYDIGAGYLIPFRKRNAMVLSMGYSVKEMEEYYGVSPCSGWGGNNCEVYYEKYTYQYRRISVKIGWRF